MVPTPLDGPPAQLGTAYEMPSYHVRLPDVQRHRDGTAAYYPDCVWDNGACGRGVVRAEVGEENRWFLLDADRDAMLRRYIELGKEGLLPERPTVLEVLSARVAHQADWIEVEVEDVLLDSKQLQLFWQEARLTERRTIHPFPLRSLVLRVLFRLPEGRDLELRYLPWSGDFIDMSSVGNVLTPEVPVQAMNASPSLQRLLEFVAPDAPLAPRPAAAASSTGEGPIVPVWALVLIAAAGTALVATGALAAGRRVTVRGLVRQTTVDLYPHSPRRRWPTASRPG